MANGDGLGVDLNALLLKGLLDARPRADVPEAGGQLGLLQGLMQTSPVFDSNRSVGGLGQVGRALTPIAATIAAQPMIEAKQAAANRAANLELIKGGLELKKKLLEVGALEQAAELDAGILGLLNGEQLPQGQTITVKGKQATLQQKGPPFKSATADALDRLAGALGGGGDMKRRLEARKHGLIEDPNDPPVFDEAGNLVSGRYVPSFSKTDVSKARETLGKVDQLDSLATTLEKALLTNPNALNVRGKAQQVSQGVQELFSSSVGPLVAENNLAVAQEGGTPVDLSRFDPSLGVARASLNAIAFLIPRVFYGEGARMSDQDVERALTQLTGGEGIGTGGVQAATVLSNLAGLVRPLLKGEKAKAEAVINASSLGAIPDPDLEAARQPPRDDDALKRSLESILPPGSKIEIR